MEYFELGGSGIKVSRIALGTWGLGGGSVWSDHDSTAREAEDLLSACLDHGINYIDTAPVYGTGVSEELIGKAIKGRRNDFVVQTKCSLNWRGEGGNFHYERDGYTVNNDTSAAAVKKDVEDILRYDTFHTMEILGQELHIKLDELEGEWHYNSLERIFFENKIYKILERDQKDWDTQIDEIFAQMKTYQDLFRREIVREDILKLVEKPVRKISKFDTKAIDEKILAIEDEMRDIQYKLDHLTRYTIDWFKALKKKYGKDFPRQTEITSFETIAVNKVVNNNAKLYANLKDGFVGMNLKKEDGVVLIGECSDLSEIVVIDKQGRYKITKISDKAFFWPDLIYVGVFNRGDTRTIYNVIYREGKSSVYYAKRFAVTSVTRDKEYDITTGLPGSQIVWFTANHNGEAETVRVQLRPKPKLKKTSFEYDFSTLAVKSKTVRGNLVSKYAIRNVTLRSKGVSTITGKDIWYDTDIQKLNEDGHGLYLGQFKDDDKVLAVFRGGTFYTTSFDLVNKYQGDVLLIEKFDPDKTFTALYWDGAVKSFYVKRFSFVLSDNTPLSFISDAPKSYLVDLSGDAHPRYEIVWKLAEKEPEAVEAETWIGKKGIAAKGKKCAERGEVKSVRFIEPLIVDEPEEEEEAVIPSEPPVIPSEAEESPAEPPVIPAVEPESPPSLDEVPDFPGGLFDEPTLF